MDADIAEPHKGHNLDRKGIVAVFAGLMVAMFVSSLDQTIASTALPTIVGELGGVNHMLWVTTAYMLTSTITMPIYGKLGDLFGRKYLFCACLGFFVVGSLVCALTPSMAGLIAGRAIQGLGGGGMMILSQAIVADIFPPRERGKYMGIMGAVFGVSSVLGPLLGGFFTQQLTWRWCFWINVPLGIAACVCVFLFLPHRIHAVRRKGSIDVWGIATMAAATTCFVLAMSWGGNLYAWSDPLIIGLFAAAVVFAACFVVAERKAAEPIIPLGFFRNRNFMVCTVAGLLIMVGMMGVLSYLPTYFQIVDGLSATLSGFMTLPMMGGMMITSTVSGFLASKTGRVKWMPLAGTSICAIGFVALSALTVDTSLLYIGVWLFVIGFGIGLGQQMLVLIVQNEFSSSIVGTATASNNFFREIGGTVGSALVGSLFTSNLSAQLADNFASIGGVGALGVDANSLTPAIVSALDPALQSLVRLSYNDALTPVLLTLAPLLVCGIVLIAFVKERPLKTEND